MNTPQIEPVTTLARDHKSVFAKLGAGPVFLAQRSKSAAVLLSIGDYEKLVADAESAKRFRRLIKADQAFIEMNAGNYVELAPDEILALV